ncbi:hypothetical protein O3P69_013958 [Scylla paramamosain]|uniref:Uncharacterized protein n=1 Tax=Scylla paramamosain TaxID=85552 RepID=A0AAW0SSJ6_SCYPA
MRRSRRPCANLVTCAPPRCECCPCCADPAERDTVKQRRENKAARTSKHRDSWNVTGVSVTSILSNAMSISVLFFITSRNSASPCASCFKIRSAFIFCTIHRHCFTVPILLSDRGAHVSIPTTPLSLYLYLYLAVQPLPPPPPPTTRAPVQTSMRVSITTMPWTGRGGTKRDEAKRIPVQWVPLRRVLRPDKKEENEKENEREDELVGRGGEKEGEGEEEEEQEEEEEEEEEEDRQMAAVSDLG